jgi:hypothetical protein
MPKNTLKNFKKSTEDNIIAVVFTGLSCRFYLLFFKGVSSKAKVANIRSKQNEYL